MIKNNPKDPFRYDFSKNIKNFSTNLTSYLEQKSKDKPFVISISAPWGMGKTSLIDMWGRQLIEDKKLAIKYDAWRDDYNENPLMSILAVLNEQLQLFQTKQNKKLITSVKKAGVKLLLNLAPLAINFLLNTVSGGAAGALIEQAKEIVGNEVIDVSKKAGSELKKELNDFCSKQLEDHAAKRQSVEDFKIAIKKFINTSKSKTLFFFIDELDRCRPLYSVQVLEIIKHFFDIDHVCFIVASNTNSLFKTLQKVYGNNFQSEEYFERFIDRHISIPNVRKEDFVEHKIQEFKEISEIDKSVPGFLNIIKSCCCSFGLNLREIQKYLDEISDFIVLNHSQKVPNYFMPIIVYLLVVKRKMNEKFSEYIENGMHESIQISKLSAAESESIRWIKEFFFGTRAEKILAKTLADFRSRLNYYHKALMNPDELKIFEALKLLDRVFVSGHNSIYKYNGSTGNIENYINYLEETKKIFNFIVNFNGEFDIKEK